MIVSNPDSSEARERVLDVAERLFSQHGFKAVTLRDIAAHLDMKVSSLYYHAPKGKEELFVAVLERNMTRHHEEMQRIIAEQPEDWQAQLYGVAHWLLSKPLPDSTHLMRTDIHELKPQHAQQVLQSMYLVMQPVEQIFAHALNEIGKTSPDPGLLAGVFLTIVNGLNAAPQPFDPSFTKQKSVDQILGLLIKGLLAE
jgi:TetR/AcrR family transcriptional regulator, cholesterol catabolism regulator